MTSAPREERRPAAQALTLGLRHPVLPAAVRVERRIAVRAHDAQVLDPVVVVHAVDVIEDQRHPPPVPDLALPAELTSALLEPGREQALLQLPAVGPRALDQELCERRRRS